MSTPTSGRIELVTQHAVDPQTLIGLDAKLSAERHDGTRHWEFVITGASYLDSRSDWHRFECRLVHPLGLLALRKDTRAFQKMTLLQIIEKLVEPARINSSMIQWQADDNPIYEYVVQYRETDLAFLHRMLAEAGLTYVIGHTGTQSTIIVGDAVGDFGGQDAGSIELLEGEFGSGISDFQIDFDSIPDAFATNDYNYESPNVALAQKVTIGKNSNLEWYEYPSGYDDPGVGKRLAQRRAESFVCRQVVGSGRSESQQFAPGVSFTLSRIDNDAPQPFFVIEADHHWQLRLIEGRDLPASYQNRFRCTPKRGFYRMPWHPVRPSVEGPLSAVVTVQGGDEIHTETLGRAKLQFYWDRLNPRDDTASCWTRVIQIPLGGSLAVLRKDWEMLVRHVDGDPNRPVAVARMDNATHTAPYAYPNACTSLAWKTLSSPGAGKHNEYSLEDSGGKMGFLSNSARDYREQTLHFKTEKITVNDKLTVDVDHSTTVDADQKCTIGVNWTKTVSKDSGESITANRKLSVGAAETVTISKTLEEKIVGADSEKVGASYMTLAGMSISRTSMGGQSLTVGGALITAAGLSCSVAVAGSKSETIGGAKITAAKGSIEESVMGAMSITVGAVCVNSAKGNRMSSAESNTKISVGGALVLSGGSKVQIHAKTITIKAGAIGNFLGGGGIMSLTPASASFVGLITVDASGKLKMVGAPNLAG